MAVLLAHATQLAADNSEIAKRSCAWISTHGSKLPTFIFTQRAQSG